MENFFRIGSINWCVKLLPDNSFDLISLRWKYIWSFLFYEEKILMEKMYLIVKRIYFQNRKISIYLGLFEFIVYLLCSVINQNYLDYEKYNSMSTWLLKFYSYTVNYINIVEIKLEKNFSKYRSKYSNNKKSCQKSSHVKIFS